MPIEIEVNDRVAVVTLNRPEAMNSIDPSMREQLQATWRRLAEDDDIWVAVVTGAGDRAFCTGSDLKGTPPPAESYAAQTFGSAVDHHLLAGMQMDKPTIAAVNGYAVGGGLEIALGCDIRLASRSASFGLSEVRVGSIPGAGGSQRLPRLMHHSMAMQMLFTGQLIDADTALRTGLVSEVVGPEDLLPRAKDIAAQIAANAPLSVRAVKRLVRTGENLPLTTALEVEGYVWGLLRDAKDRLEGREAFVQKRPPRYAGQ